MMTADPQTKLSELRQKLRQIDRSILELVAARQGIAQEIGQIKIDSGLPVKDFAVEKAVLEASRAICHELNLYESLGTDLMSCLIKYSVISQDEYHQRQKTLRHDGHHEILVIGGLGRMGQWIAEFFASFGHNVSLLDKSSPSAQKTDHHGFPILTDLKEGIQKSDVIVLATPLEVTASLLRIICNFKPRGLIFDIGSLKSPIMDELRLAADSGLQISSVHPMFGPNVETLSGRNILVCHVKEETATEKTMELFRPSTAQLVRISLDEHDALMSYVLGLSHLINLIFAHVLRRGPFSPELLKSVASTTFNAQLGVALPVVSENKDLYFAIQVLNGHTPHLLRELTASLSDYSNAVDSHDFVNFSKFMEESQQFLRAFY